MHGSAGMCQTRQRKGKHFLSATAEHPSCGVSCSSSVEFVKVGLRRRQTGILNPVSSIHWQVSVTPRVSRSHMKVNRGPPNIKADSCKTPDWTWNGCLWIPAYNLNVQEIWWTMPGHWWNPMRACSAGAMREVNLSHCFVDFKVESYYRTWSRFQHLLLCFDHIPKTPQWGG